VTLVGLGGGTLAVGFGGGLPFEVSATFPYWGSRVELMEVVALARQGLVSSHVETFSLEDAPMAYERLHAGRINGRAVVLPHGSTRRGGGAAGSAPPPLPVPALDNAAPATPPEGPRRCPRPSPAHDRIGRPEAGPRGPRPVRASTDEARQPGSNARSETRQAERHRPRSGHRSGSGRPRRPYR
jgi:hypothetical protein